MKMLAELKLKYENEVDFAQWSKKLLKTSWFICLFITIGAIGIFSALILNGEYEIKFTGMSYIRYAMIYIIIPFVLIAASILASQTALTFFGKKKQYAMQAFTCLLCLNCMAAIVTITHYTVGGIYMSFSFICFISLIYIDRKLVIFSAVISVLTYLAIVFLFLSGKSAAGEIKHGVEEIITTVIFICSSAAITVYILSRKEILISNVMQLKNGIVYTMADLVENRDKNTGGHIDRTSLYMKILTDAMLEKGVYADEIHKWNLESIVSSARLHDVGKITIPDSILNKPGPLTKEEYEVIKSHSQEGESIINKTIKRTGNAVFLQNAKMFAAYHHERWDGNGYPYALCGAAIPLPGRLLAIIDVYDALVSERPYKKTFTHEEAMDIIVNDSGKHFDPLIANVFKDVSVQIEAAREKYYHIEAVPN